MKRLFAVTAIAMLLLPRAGQAQTFTDTAANPAYAGGYSSGQGGGIPGFGPFKVVASATAAGGSAGTFIYTAKEAEGNLGSPLPGSIDTNGKSFGFFAHGMSAGAGDPIVTITRTFNVPTESAGLTCTGDTFALDFVTGYNDGGSVGVALTTASGTVGRFIYQTGNHYQFNDAVVPNQSYKMGALHLVYTLTSSKTFSFTCTGAVTYSGTGTFSSPITGFQVLQINATGPVGNPPGSDISPARNGYFNNLSLKCVAKTP